MTVVAHGTPKTLFDAGELADEHPRCFFCGDAVDSGIYWSGITGDVYLHEQCAGLLAVRLARDVHELQTEAAKG